MKGEIDLALCQNKELFLKIKTQSDLFVGVFEELANDFPLDLLRRYHPDSRGCKISKGYRLDGCPYEVLDICRDFDAKTGFNIRVLQWWGHQTYLIVMVGRDHRFVLQQQLPRLKGYRVSTETDPWQYAKSLSTGTDLQDYQFGEGAPVSGFFQLYKAIEIPNEPQELKEILKREILLILDNHN